RRCEEESRVGVRPLERPLERGVERPVPAVDLLIDDGPDLQRPRVFRKFSPLIPRLERKAQVDRPSPRFRHTHARTDVIADPFPAAVGLDAREEIEPGLEPRREAVRDLERLVRGMLGANDPVLGAGRAEHGCVAVELHHRLTRRGELAAVDLDLEVALSACVGRREGERRERDDDGQRSGTHGTDSITGHARLRATMSTPFGRKPPPPAGAVEPRWVTTANDFEGHRIAEYRGVVRGIVVRSRSVLGNIGASVQTFFGGNITLYTNLCERAREDAYGLMLRHAA